MKLKFRAEPKDVVIFIIFAIFLLYLVAIGILNLHSLTVDSRFWGINPIPAFYPEFLAATLIFYLLALIGLSMTVSSYFFDREKGFGFEAGRKNEDGFARFASAAEMKKKPDIERIFLADDEYNAAGMPIILNEKEAWVDNGENHSLIIGGTGSGKSQCAMIPMARILAKAGESMIFTDPKGELYRDIGGLLKERGYNIVVLNFRDPLRGNCWNPFSLPYKFYKEGKDDKSKELIEDLAENILINPESKAEPFWEESAASYFAGLAMGLFEDAPSEEYVNINSVNQMATSGEQRFGNGSYLMHYFKDKGDTSAAYISAAATINAPNETKASIVSEFKNKIKKFSSREAMTEMLSKTDFDFSKIGKQKSAVFLIIHDEKKTYHSLVTIFLKQIYESLVDVASTEPNLRLPVRTNFMLDEFANMPPLKDVDAMISASRSRNMRFNFIIQNYSQLNTQYGADMAETIKGNCGNILFLTTTELKALEEISKLCGEKKGKKNKDKPDEPSRPLMTVSDLQKLKKFEFLILRLRCQPFKVQFTPDYEINKHNGWGAVYDAAELPSREPNTAKIFDIKEFVEKRMKEKMMEEGADPSAGGGMRIPPGMPTAIPPYMMGNGRPNPKPKMPSMDEFLKNIDATIAKLEAEEKAKEEEKKKKEKKEAPKQEEIVEKNEKEEKETLKQEEIEETTKKEEPKKEQKEELPKEEIKKPLIIESQIEPKVSISEDVPEEPKVETPKEDVSSIEKEQPKEEEKIEKNISGHHDEDKVISLGEVLKEERKEEEKPVVNEEKEAQGKEIESLMSIIAEGKKDKPKEEKHEEKKEEHDEKKNNIKSQIEKPKINVDADSIVVEENVTDDQFFDDFFGDDE